MKIAIGNDHAATALKFEMMDYLGNLGHELVNFGTDVDASVNYPDYGEAVARAVARKEVDCGVLICGTGMVRIIDLSRAFCSRGLLTECRQLDT